MRSRPLLSVLAKVRSTLLPLLVGLPLSLGGCGGLDPVATYEPLITDPAQMFVRLTLDYGAVNLSTAPPYDTLQVTATAWNALGDPLPTLTPTFTSSDTIALSVTPTGFLHAKAGATGVKVTADLLGPGNVRRRDSVWVNITANPTPPRLADSVLDLGADSAAWALIPMGVLSNLYSNILAGPRRVPEAQALDGAGNTIAGLVVEYISLDTLVATVGQDRAINRRRPGQARMVARTTAYGVTKADTLPGRVTWPVIQQIVFATDRDGKLSLTPDDVRVPPYGIVAWLNMLGDTVDVTFDDPTNVAQPPYVKPNVCIYFDAYLIPGAHCDPGNALVAGTATMPPEFEGDITGDMYRMQIRQFPVPGIYRYHSTRIGVTGRIVVTADPDPTAVP